MAKERETKDTDTMSRLATRPMRALLIILTKISSMLHSLKGMAHWDADSDWCTCGAAGRHARAEALRAAADGQARAAAAGAVAASRLWPL